MSKFLFRKLWGEFLSDLIIRPLNNSTKKKSYNGNVENMENIICQ